MSRSTPTLPQGQELRRLLAEHPTLFSRDGPGDQYLITRKIANASSGQSTTRTPPQKLQSEWSNVTSKAPQHEVQGRLEAEISPTAPSAYDAHVKIGPSIRRDDYHHRPYQAKYLKRTVAVFMILCILSLMIWNTVSARRDHLMTSFSSSS